MIAVAVAAVLLIWPTLHARQRRFGELSWFHRKAAGGPFFFSNVTPQAIAYSDRLGEEAMKLSPERRRWHDALANKYQQAARYPWLPVEADPPKPE